MAYRISPVQTTRLCEIVYFTPRGTTKQSTNKRLFSKYNNDIFSKNHERTSDLCFAQTTVIKWAGGGKTVANRLANAT
jgi:hypothetical protein